MNELGVVLVYLRLACSLLKIVLVKVGYNATSSAHFWPELCLNYHSLDASVSIIHH